MSNNPFSVPESPPALIDPPKCRLRKVAHVIAFVLILIVWYWGLALSEVHTLGFLTTFHATVPIMLIYGNQIQGDYNALLWTIELLFFAMLSITALQRSFSFTLSALVGVVCWEVAHIIWCLIFLN